MVVMWIIYIALCALVAYLGRERKFGFWLYLALSFLLSPLVGMIIVLASAKKPVAPEVDDAVGAEA